MLDQLEKPLRAALQSPREELRELLQQLFVAGAEVTPEAITNALPEVPPQLLLDAGLLSRTPRGIRAKLSLTETAAPNGSSWWILSDLDDHLRDHPVRVDHVMGVGGATRSLLEALPSHRVNRALDLGTGNGIVAMHLATQADSVIASDVSERAITFARFNAALNGISNIEFVVGSLFDPIDGVFDLIASNPPFVIAPKTDHAPTYRTSGGVGDALLRQLVSEAPRYLNTSGMLICLANWEHIDDTPWIEQPVNADVASWVIERGRQSPAEYAATWLRDGGVLEGHAEYRSQLRGWIDDFIDRGVSAVSFGYLAMRHTITPFHRVETVTGSLGSHERFGDAWSQAFTRALTLAREPDDSVLRTHFVRSDDVEEVRVLTPGTEQIRSISLVKRHGIERMIPVGTLAASIVGACDGELSLGEITRALEKLLEAPEGAFRAQAAQIAREFVASGILLQAGEDTI